MHPTCSIEAQSHGIDGKVVVRYERTCVRVGKYLDEAPLRGGEKGKKEREGFNVVLTYKPKELNVYVG